jgi:copper chaperone CopZ
MKTLVILLVLSATLFAGRTSFAQAEQKPAMKTDTIKVHDMRCGQCETRIHRALGKTAGISKDNSFADAESQTVVVQYDPSVITREKIEALIVKTGYGVGKTAGDPAARKALPSCCK